MGVLQLLASDNFITYSKVVAKKYGVNTAVLLGAMCSYQNSFGDEEFFKEQSKISEDTCLSEYEIQQALKVLKTAEIISVEKKGLPSKNYYKINEDVLTNTLITSSQNFRPLVVKKLDHIYNNNTTTKNTIINYKENIKEIVAYLNEKAKTNYKDTTPKTIQLITTRCKEGFTIEDFKKVIDNKCGEWNNTDFNKYLRPETLFGTKFEGYLNEAKPKYVNNNSYRPKSTPATNYTDSDLKKYDR